MWLISKSKSVIFEILFWACKFDLWKQLRMYIKNNLCFVKENSQGKDSSSFQDFAFAILLCYQTDMAIILSCGFDSSYFLLLSKIKGKNIRYNVPVYVNKHLVSSLRWYLTLQGDNSLKSVERFDHMMFVCDQNLREKNCYVGIEFIALSLLVGIC